MLVKSNAIERLLRENPNLGERRFGLPSIGSRLDLENFNPTVQGIADAIDFYGYKVRDEKITTIKDIDLGSGNPIKYKPYPGCINRMKEYLNQDDMYKYPYTEGNDNIRKILLDYIEQEGFINCEPYSYSDIDEKGLSVHNITFLPSTSIIFNIIINIISRPGDVVLVPGPNYGLFTIRAERAGAEVDVLPLEKEDHFYVNPEKLANKIDDINESLQKVYNRRKGYVPRVVAFLNMNPSNPTGVVMGEKENDLLQKIGNVCQERGVFVIDDLVYRDITYSDNNIAKPMASIKGMFRNTISLFGLSKSYGLASLRAGFVVADEIIIREIVNRIFQGMDSSPEITGYALTGAFNNSDERRKEYDNYFKPLRKKYHNNYLLLKALINGIDTIKNEADKTSIIEIVNKYSSKEKDEILKGIPYIDFPKNLKPEAGFFAILDFTKLKGMKYKGSIISTERDLLKFFYDTCRIRFLVGQSISWPYQDELVGRITFAVDDEYLIDTINKMRKAIQKLEEKEDYIIRYNKIEDQSQMAKIKIDLWRKTYNKIIDKSYLDKLDYNIQTQKYFRSFDEYKNRVLVAVRGNEILGYSCFDENETSYKYDSELISLYIKEQNRGIGTILFKETIKELLSRNKKNMILWCLSENKTAIKFYKKQGGVVTEIKYAKIGNRKYKEYGFYFDLERIINKEEDE